MIHSILATKKDSMPKAARSKKIPILGKVADRIKAGKRIPASMATLTRGAASFLIPSPTKSIRTGRIARQSMKSHECRYTNTKRSSKGKHEVNYASSQRTEGRRAGDAAVQRRQAAFRQIR